MQPGPIMMVQSHREPALSISPGYLEAFVAAFPTLRRLHEPCITPGLLIAAVHASGQVTGHAHLVEDGEHAVLGCHPRCRLQLVREPAVSMRHVVIALARRSDGPVVQAWAIGPSGMRSDDGSCYGTLTTRSPAAFSVGGTRVFAFATGPGAPAWTGDAATTWAGLPPQRASVGTAFPVRPGATFDGDDPTAAVDHVGQSLRVRALRLGAVVGVLRLEHGDNRAHVPLTEVGLERGVLLGRADRCDAGGRLARLSRVHALVARRDDGVWLYDAASHNGLAVGGAAVSRCRLDDGAAVELGGALTATWQPHAG